MKKIRYKIAMRGWSGWKVKEVAGHAFMHNKFRLCVRETPMLEGTWCVDEYDTGLSVAMNHKTRNDALRAARQRLDEKGDEATTRAIEDGLATLRTAGLI